MKPFQIVFLLAFLSSTCLLEGEYPKADSSNRSHGRWWRARHRRPRFPTDYRGSRSAKQKPVVVNIPELRAVGTRKIKDSPNDGYTIGVWNPNALISAKLMGITNYDHTDYEIIAMTGYTTAWASKRIRP